MKAPLNNFFVINEIQFASRKGRIPPLVNKVLKRLNLSYEFKKKINPSADMATLEQRINYYHLLTSVISEKTEGDVVELGCFNGQCAMLFQKTLNSLNSVKKLHLFDSFEVKFEITGSVEHELISNFKNNGLQLPIIHKGLFEKTLATDLPDKIAFAHIDCGFGGDVTDHKTIVLYCLEEVYKRLSKGGKCVMMDYHDAGSKDPGNDYNPGVKLACDDFFSDKPEQIICLYGGESSHGYFKKL